MGEIGITESMRPDAIKETLRRKRDAITMLMHDRSVAGFVVLTDSCQLLAVYKRPQLALGQQPRLPLAHNHVDRLPAPK
jgi:hypothetical protein